MDSDTNSSQPEVISASEILAKIERGEPVEYDGVVVEGDLDISGLDLPTEHVERTEFEIKALGLTEEAKTIKTPISITTSEIRGAVNFRNAIFWESVNFKGTNFGGYANFNGAEFSGNAIFEWAEFDDDADFRKTQFNDDADFRKAQFNDDADFRKNQFSGYADFVEAKFRGNASFGGAESYGGASFMRTQFSGYAFFGEAKFNDYADFLEAKFSGNVYFVESQFSRRASFSGAQFSGDASFGRAEFDKELCLDNLKFDRLYITWSSIRDNLVYDGPAYLALIKNFKVIERFSDADDCYYQYRTESHSRKKWYAEEFNWSKLHDCIGSVSCGYGARVGPIILWALGSVLGFTLLYKLLPQSYGGIAESGPSTATMEALNNSTLLLTFSSGDGAVTPSWGECLYFSFRALTGGTPDRLHPVGLCKYAVMIEGFLGYLFLALFVVVLARKIIR